MKTLISILAVFVITILLFIVFQFGRESAKIEARSYWYSVGWDEGYKLGKQRGEERAVTDLQILYVTNNQVALRIGYFGDAQVYTYK